MTEREGKSVLKGIAMGPIKVYKKAETAISETSARSAEEEKTRFEAAQTKAQTQLAELYEKALREDRRHLRGSPDDAGGRGLR